MFSSQALEHSRGHKRIPPEMFPMLSRHSPHLRVPHSPCAVHNHLCLQEAAVQEDHPILREALDVAYGAGQEEAAREMASRRVG